MAPNERKLFHKLNAYIEELQSFAEILNENREPTSHQRAVAQAVKKGIDEILKELTASYDYKTLQGISKSTNILVYGKPIEPLKIIDFMKEELLSLPLRKMRRAPPSKQLQA